MSTPRSRRTQPPRSRPAKTARRAAPARPLPRGDSLYTPRAGNTRRTLERSSARPLAFLHQLPGWLPPILLVALLVAGFTLPGLPGAAALGVVAAFLGWLAYVSWPALPGRGRLLRLAAVACVLVIAVIQARR